MFEFVNNLSYIERLFTCTSSDLINTLTPSVSTKAEVWQSFFISVIVTLGMHTVLRN